MQAEAQTGTRTGQAEPKTEPQAEQTPFLSIVMPAYNGENFIRDAIASALEQPCSDLELLIGNDGSTDSTLAVCEEIAAGDGRVHIDDHENFGVGKNLNRLLRMARGKWLIILAQDDAIVSGFYNEDLKEFLGTCLKNEIDVIVPARLQSQMGDSMTELDYVPEHGLVGQYSDASWDIQHELSSLLYAMDNIRDNELYFYEGFVEMESVWRHKNVYTARKALFTNDFYFAIRHRHEKQITSTWDFFKVSPLRIDAYWDLCKWHEQVNGDDARACQRSWDTLSDIVVDYVLAAYDRFGTGREMEESLRIEPVGKLMDDIPAQFDKAHRRILKKHRHKRVLEQAKNNRQEWQHVYPCAVKGTERFPFDKLVERSKGFPEVYRKLASHYGL